MDKWRECGGLQKALLVIQILQLLLAIAMLGVAFAITSIGVDDNADWVDSSDVTSLLDILRNCALSGAVSLIITQLVGISGSALVQKVLLILFTVFSSCDIVILIVSGVVPLIADAFINVACNSIDSCYVCPSGTDDGTCGDSAATGGYDCYYYDADYTALCVKLKNELDFIVGASFVEGVLCLTTAIMTCVALSQINRKTTVTTTVIVTPAPGQPQSNVVYAAQPPGQPQPGQPMMYYAPPQPGQPGYDPNQPMYIDPNQQQMYMQPPPGQPMQGQPMYAQQPPPV